MYRAPPRACSCNHKISRPWFPTMRQSVSYVIPFHRLVPPELVCLFPDYLVEPTTQEISAGRFLVFMLRLERSHNGFDMPHRSCCVDAVFRFVLLDAYACKKPFAYQLIPWRSPARLEFLGNLIPRWHEMRNSRREYQLHVGYFLR